MVPKRRLVLVGAGALGLLVMSMWWSRASMVGLRSWHTLIQGTVSPEIGVSPPVTDSSAGPQSSATTPEDALWHWFSPDLPLRVKAFKVLERSRPDTARFRVVISAERDTPLPFGWRPGDNIRWVTLQRTASGWVIADVASTPTANSPEASLQPGFAGPQETGSPAPVVRSPGDS